MGVSFEPAPGTNKTVLAPPCSKNHEMCPKLISETWGRSSGTSVENLVVLGFPLRREKN